MHVYTIDNDLRRKVIVYIFVISIILSSLFTRLFGGMIFGVKEWLKQYQWVTELLELCDSFGVTTNVIGIPFLYGAIYWLFDNYIWKWKCLGKILNVPNLNGCWEGQLTSNTYGTTIKMKLNVVQTWSRISFVSSFPNSKSESNVASIFIERDGIVKVGFGFINHSRELSHQYDGYNIIDIDDTSRLFGRYFNNRDNSNLGHNGGNIGTFKLQKVA